MAASDETPPACEAEKAVVSWWNDLRERATAGADRLSCMDPDSIDFFMSNCCSSAHKLSGGFVNFVCRAFLDNAAVPDGTRARHATKHASVIVKRFSNSVHNAFSYEIERSALWLCNSVPLPLSASRPPIVVRVPRLLAYDDETRTIVMEDAGVDAKMLSEWLLLSDAPASEETVGSPKSLAQPDIAAAWPELTADNLASGIAALFDANRAASSAAALIPPHSTIVDSSAPSPPFSLKFRSQASFSEKCQFYTDFSARALSFGVPAPIVEALDPRAADSEYSAEACNTGASVARSLWPRRADAVHDGWDWSVVITSQTSQLDPSDDFANSNKGATATSPAVFSPAGLSLIVGDLWPNSVLIHAAERTVWVVDWEAADIGRPGRDAALLIDHLWIMTQNPSKYDCVKAQKLICSLGSVFFPAYGGSIGRASPPTHKVDWRLGREPEFLRSVAMFAGSPHYGIDHSAALRRALDEISALSK